MTRYSLPPAFKAKDEVTKWILDAEHKALTALHAGLITEENIDIARSCAKVAVRVAQKARKAPHTRGKLEHDQLVEAERVCLAMLATLRLIERDGAVNDNHRAVIDAFEPWNRAMNYEIPRAVWLASYGKLEKRK